MTLPLSPGVYRIISLEPVELEVLPNGKARLRADLFYLQPKPDGSEEFCSLRICTRGILSEDPSHQPGASSAEPSPTNPGEPPNGESPNHRP